MPTFEKITEQMPGGFLIYTADKNEKILEINTAAIEMFGCTSKEEFLDFVHGSFRRIVFALDLDAVTHSPLEDAGENSREYLVYRIRRKDGEIRWIEDYRHLVRTEDKGDLYYAFLYDITEKKHAEQGVGITSDALNCAKKLNAAKSTFIFNLSHDIRTPMNAILGFTDLAERHIEETEKARGYLRQVQAAGRHMLMLIDDLLELSELDAKIVHLSLKPVDLAQVVEETVNMVKMHFDEKLISVSLNIEEGKVQVLLDVPHFQRALFNILSNSAKFTQKKGSVKVSIRQTKVSESGYARYSIQVEDNGIGMSPEFLPKAFDAFEREKTSTRSGQIGTGIGLTVTKRIMDVMGGSVAATSELGKGSSFTLSLPLKIDTKQQVLPQTSANQLENTPAKGRILIVEDIEINRMLAEAVLTESGFDVESVADGCDAVEAIKNAPEGYYLAVLMDIQMPIMNGYEATRAIRAIDRKDIPRLPIIALSANARAEDKEKSFESGMNAHVAKPFDVAGLIATINKYSALL